MARNAIDDDRTEAGFAGANPTPRDLEAAVRQLGADETALSEAQAEALVERELLGRSRSEVSERVGISKSGVDNRVQGGKANVATAVATVNALLSTGLLDALDDYALVTPQSDETPHAARGEPAAADATPTPRDEPEADTFDLGRLLSFAAVTKVTRGTDGESITVKLQDASDDVLDETEAILATAGFANVRRQPYGTSGVVEVRGRGRHGEPTEDTPEEPEADSAPTDASHDDGGETPERETVLDADELVDGIVDEPTVGAHRCDACHRLFDSPAALGGHRRYCEALQERREEANAGVETLPGIGEKKAANLRSRGFETVEDVATASAPDVMDKPTLGGKVAVEARYEARKRLGIGQHADGE